AQPRVDGGVLGGVQGWRGGAWRPRADRGTRVYAGDRVLRVRFSQVARRRVRPARLPVRVAQALSPRRVLLRPLQQSADGVLLARRPGTRRRAERGRDPATGSERE